MDSFRWTCPGCSGPLAEGNFRTCRSCGLGFDLRDGIWQPAQPFEPPGFSADRREILHELETDHFWFRPRRRALEKRLQRLFPTPGGSAIELGCGSGQFLRALGDRFAEVVAVDGHIASLQTAAASRCGATLVHGDVTAVPLDSGQFDLVVALDVLEHLDPVAFLAEAARLVRPSGHLLLSVPAFPILWSPLDERAGHRCRYRLSRLRREMDSTGWTLTGHTHFQFLLFPLVLISRRLLPTSDSGVERKPPRLLGRLLGAVNRVEVSLLSRCSLPFGSSLFAWGRRSG